MLFITGDRLFDGNKFLPEGSVLALDNGRVADILPAGQIEDGRIQKLKGVITPGFVNAHCHTELSHLKNVVPRNTGLPGFGKHIIAQRNAFAHGEILEHLAEADKEMHLNGIVAVGDICNTSHSFKTKETSGIFYHSFIELLGLHPGMAADVYEKGLRLLDELKSTGLSGSLAPHAPYSTSAELIRLISAFNISHQYPSSIHNQESPEETKFFMGEKNEFQDLYAFLQADISWFKAPGTSSLPYYAPALGRQQTLLVHNTCTSASDIEQVKDQNIFWCFCPNANQYIENRLPDFNLFSSFANTICLGTDSLASNTQLSLISEAILLMQASNFTEEEILKSITSNPAKALKLDDKFGELAPGKAPGLNLIELKNRQMRFIKKLT